VEQNGTVWLDGELTSWDEARLPLMSDAVLRSLCVFDGMMARRQDDGSMVLIAFERHIRRLRQSCGAVCLPMTYTDAEMLTACSEVVAAETLGHPDYDVYVRPMVVGAALSHRAESASMTIAAFRRPIEDGPAPVRMGTSSWRRPTNDSMPASVKAVANYQLARLARMEAKAAGYDDALVLNAAGRVAEAAGSAILIERNGVIGTPPSWDDCLDSITVHTLAAVASDVGVPFERRPILRTEALSADGLALAGTLADVVPVSRLDLAAIDVTSPLLASLRNRFAVASRGGKSADLLEAVPCD
jgi:branched-chain amino acid aminotransferase